MKIKIELKNGREVQKNIEKIPSLGIDGIMDAFFIGANNIRNRVLKSMRNTKKASWSYNRAGKRHHPSKPGSAPAIDSSELITSIIVAKSRGKVEVGARAPYAIWLEKGTSKMAARPFLAPAADIELPKLRKLIAKMAEKKIMS